MNHCWKDRREWLEENGRRMSDEWLDTFDDNETCMAPDGITNPVMWPIVF